MLEVVVTLVEQQGERHSKENGEILAELRGMRGEAGKTAVELGKVTNEVEHIKSDLARAEKATAEHEGRIRAVELSNGISNVKMAAIIGLATICATGLAEALAQLVFHH
jgi:flagellin-like hook-associated protein FlgL